jgi:4-oxalmesaconate hydratase
MIIDCHGHFTTVPRVLNTWRQKQLETGGNISPAELKISDDELREALEGGQIKRIRERGTDKVLFSPIAGWMGHHQGTPEISRVWSEVSNNLIHRVCNLYPEYFIGVCQLPQSPGADLKASAQELERCVTELGFVGCNFNPDPSGGYWQDPPVTDRHYYPLYEKMCELNVPAMIHVSASCNPCFHHTGAHYLNGDTAVFMQLLLQPQLFKDFPTLRFIIPHGGGAVPYHWGRYRGLAQDMGMQALDTGIMNNVYFDTCVYHQAGIDVLARVVKHKNILFGSEMIGAVKGVDPETGHYYDDTKRYVSATPHLDDRSRQDLFFNNILNVYPRLKAKVAA